MMEKTEQNLGFQVVIIAMLFRYFVVLLLFFLNRSIFQIGFRKFFVRY